jgi:hypothetical protein
MNIKDDIKALIVQSGITMSKVVEAINVKYNRNDSLQNLSRKLSRNTLRYSDALEIAEAIGYEIKWTKKD